MADFNDEPASCELASRELARCELVSCEDGISRAHV